MSRNISVLFVCLLTGCIILPAPEREPYDESEIAKITSNVSAREEVLDLFGSPQVTRLDDTIWLYGKTRRVAVGAGISTSGAGIGAWLDNQFLLVEFEDDIVRNIELFEDEYGGCSTTGICLASGWNGEVHQWENMLLVSDSPVGSKQRQDDMEAKQFQTEMDSCTVYIFSQSHIGAYYKTSSRNPRIKIGQIQTPLLHPSVYFYSVLKRGLHRLIVFLPEFGSKYKAVESSVEFECEGDHLFFFDVNVEVEG